MIHQLWNKHFSQSQLRGVFNEKIKIKRSVGVDRITVEKFEENLNTHIAIIEKKCHAGTYKFTPYLQQLQSKGATRFPRQISVPSVRDRLVLKSLTNFMHEAFKGNVAKDLPNTVIKNIIASIKENPDDAVYIKLDFSSFYDSIPQAELIEVLKKTITKPETVKLIYKSIQNPTLQTNYRKDKRKNINRNGVPQGLSVSNILAEIYLESFDNTLKPLSLSYYRFVDDVFILCKRENVQNVWLNIRKAEQELKLTLNMEKSTNEGTYKHTKDGFEFLGYHLKNENQITVRESSYNNYVQGLISIIIKYKHVMDKSKKDDDKIVKTHAFIDELNEKITGAISEKRRYGWSFFFSEINDYDMLNKIDWIIVDTLKRINTKTLDAVLADKSKDLSIKRVIRAHYEAKNSPRRGYIKDYNTYKTTDQKLGYLKFIGILDADPDKSYAEEHIIKVFKQVMQRNLSKLVADTARISG